MENKDLIATALSMIGKNIILIADCIHKEDEPATAEEKPKRKTRKTAKSKTEEAADVHETEPVPEEAEKPKVTFEQVRAALAKKSQILDFLEDYGYIAQIPDINKPKTGRPPLPKYAVNPYVYVD